MNFDRGVYRPDSSDRSVFGLRVTQISGLRIQLWRVIGLQMEVIIVDPNSDFDVGDLHLRLSYLRVG